MALERIGIADIREGYNMYKHAPYYGLYDATNQKDKPGNLLFSYKGDDRDNEGWKTLQENLTVAENTAPQNLFYIRFYDELGKNNRLDSTTPYTGGFKLRMKPRESFTPGAVGALMTQAPAGSDFLHFLMKEREDLKEDNEELRARVEELEDQLKAAEQPAGQEISGVIGTIGAAGNQFPWLADIIKDWSTVLKHKLTGSTTPAHRPAMSGGIAGVDPAAAAAPPPERINAAITKLLTWYTVQEGDPKDAAARERGAMAMANDLTMLANLTDDQDMILLALKKLRAIA